MTIECADFLSEDDLNIEVGPSEGVFPGPKGAFHRVVVGNGDNLETGL